MELSIAAENRATLRMQGIETSSTREQAIQEAKLREQTRIANMEANLRLIELGAGLMSGGAKKPSAKKTQSQTYYINGQRITCNTAGNITNCY